MAWKTCGYWYGISLGRPLGTTKRGGASCYFRETCGYHSRLEGYGVRSGEACVNCQQIIYTVILQFCTKLHCASQEQSHVCLGSHLTKPSLPCMCGYGQTAAIHVTCQHNMRNFLGCKILQGPHPTAWDQESLPFRPYAQRGMMGRG